MIRRHHKFMVGYTRNLLSSLKRPVMVYLVSLSFTAQFAFAGMIFALESADNPNINSFFDALYFTVTVMTGVGLGDISAVTVPGRALSIAMMLCGTAIYVCFTAVLASLILEAGNEGNKL